MRTKPFTPMGKTYLIPADASAPTGVQVPADSPFENKSGGSFRIFNSSAVIVHVGWGGTAAQAQANSVAAVAGTPQNSVVIAPGAVEVLGFADGSFFSGISASAASVYITAGEGV